MASVPIPSPPAPTPLRVSGLPMPPYRYVPGLQPHPWRSAEGHQHNASLPEMDPLWWPELSWSEHMLFLHACDLFDHRFAWEAHEVWEEIWHAVPREHPDRARLQLLIQAAACCLKVHAQSLGPARSLLARCRARAPLYVDRVVDSSRLLIDLQAFIEGGSWPVLWGLEGARGVADGPSEGI